MVRVLCLTIFTLLAAYDAAAAANPLIGQWNAAEEGVKVIFRDGGTLSIITKSGSQPGSWKTEDERLVMTLRPTLAGDSVTITCRYAIDGDNLTIRPGDAKCGESSFKRSR